MFYNELIGLVACGGNSRRMGADKSLLTYRDKPQRYFLYDILNELCSSVYLSCNREQSKYIPEGYRYITDHPDYADAGPLTATLSAFRQLPGRDLLLIACDYPLLNKDEIQRFIEFVAGKNKPAAFYDLMNEVPVPVLGYYPAGSEALMLKVRTDPYYSLKKLLAETPSLRYVPSDPRVLLSAETPEDHSRLLKLIH
jgi:molybdopterin-guanine dinucleotide biosynthesis protein A